MDSSDVRSHDRLSSLPPLEVEQLIKPLNWLGDPRAAFMIVLQCLMGGLYAGAAVRFQGVIPTLCLIVLAVLYRIFWVGRRRLLAAAIIVLCAPIYMLEKAAFAAMIARHYDEIEAGARMLCLPITLAASFIFLSRTTVDYLQLLLRDPRIPKTVRRERASWYRGFLKIGALLLSALKEWTKSRDASLTDSERRRHRVRARELRRLGLFPWAQMAVLTLVWLPAELKYRVASEALPVLCLPALAIVMLALLFVKDATELRSAWRNAYSSYLTGPSGPQHVVFLRRLIIGIAITSQTFQAPAFDWRTGAPGRKALVENARHLAFAYFHGSPWPVYHEAFNLLLGLCFPLLFLGGVFVVTCAPLLRVAEQALDGEEATILPWEGYVQEMATSANLIEREHLWLGTHATQGYPVVLDRSILMEHSYETGDSGSGKTSLGLIPLVIQLIRIRDYEEVVATVTGSWKAVIQSICQGELRKALAVIGGWRKKPVVELRDTPHGAVIVIDLKGDPALLETTRIEAEAAGKTFKVFTNEMDKDKATFAYNPFTSIDSGVSLNQWAEMLLEAVGASHGEGYGRSYYGRVSRRRLVRDLRDFEATYGRPARSFAELDRFARQQQQKKTGGRQAQDKEQQDAFEIVAAIESLAAFPQLNITADTPGYADVHRNAIHMPDVLKNREVIYFWLPSSKESATVREIAKLALYDLMLCAQNMPGKHPVYVVIDEFQRIAADNLKVILQQARSMQISINAANQTIADMATPDADLRPTVQTNTRLKLVFAATDVDQQKWVMTMGGEYIDLRTTTSTTHSVMAGSTPKGGTSSETWGESVSQAEERLPRLQQNDIIRLCDDPLQCIAHLSRGSRYSQFGGFSIPVRLCYPYTLEEFNTRRVAPWPAHQVGVTMIARDAATHVGAAHNNGAQATTTKTTEDIEVATSEGADARNTAQDFQEMLRAAQERLQQKQDSSRPSKRRRKEQE